MSLNDIKRIYDEAREAAAEQAARDQAAAEAEKRAKYGEIWAPIIAACNDIIKPASYEFGIVYDFPCTLPLETYLHEYKNVLTPLRIYFGDLGPDFCPYKGITRANQYCLGAYYVADKSPSIRFRPSRLEYDSIDEFYPSFYPQFLDNFDYLDSDWIAAAGETIEYYSDFWKEYEHRAKRQAQKTNSLELNSAQKLINAIDEFLEDRFQTAQEESERWQI